jgi:disulfide bond formation protein DsbB
MDKKQACPLCFYQRTLALGLVAVLGQGLLSGGVRPRRLALLALPLALGGLGVAAFHVSLEVREILECPAGLFDIATAPKQSLAMFILLTLLLLAGAGSGLTAGEVSGWGMALAVVLGAGLAWASLSANPKMPDPPSKPYETPLTVCRPPYHGPSLVTLSERFKRCRSLRALRESPEPLAGLAVLSPCHRAGTPRLAKA